MLAALRAWSFLVLSLGYLLAAHIALLNRSAALAAFAVTLLALLVVTSIKGRFRMLWRLLVGAAGAWAAIMVARGAPQVPSSEILLYARRVTWAWVLLLVSMALLNMALICNLEPGGLIAIAGFQPPWPVSPAAFAWFSSTGTYLIIGGMFVVEFVVRILRFPDYRFRNPVEFLRVARSRMPNLMAAFRNG